MENKIETKIEQVIDSFEEYIDSCRMAMLSNTKMIVERPQIEAYLEDLRKYTPEEVKKFQRMINNRDKILADAKKKATEIEDKAKAYADMMAEESQIMKIAYEKANELMEEAQRQANEVMNQANVDAAQIRTGVLNYAKEMLTSIETIIGSTIEDHQSRYTSMITTLQEHHNVVLENLSALDHSEEEVKKKALPQNFFENDENPDAEFSQYMIDEDTETDDFSDEDSEEI